MTQLTDPFGGQPVDFKDDPENPHMVLEVNRDLRIPKRDGNRHYEAYKRWLAQGNTPRPSTQFSDRKDRKLAKVTAYRNKRLDALTVTVGAKRFPADPRTAAYIALIQATVNAGTPLPSGFSVRTVSGEKINIGEAQLAAYAAEIAKIQFQTINDVWNKVDQIKAAQNDSELEAVALEP